jgi:hypothetical protein
VATDGGVVVIAARDGGRADQGGVVLAKRATPGDAAHCGAGDISMTTIEAGDWVAVANIPDFEPPQVGSPSAAGHRRILTYNVAFLHATATYPSGLPPLPSC